MMSARFSLVMAWLLLVLASPSMAAEAPEVPAEAGPKRAEYDKVLTQWKDLLAELTTLQVQHREADAAERADIRKKWDALITQGDALQPKLFAAAEAAFVEAPDADPQITDLLIDVLVGHVQTRALGPERARFVQLQTDDYEEAWRLAGVLIGQGCKDKRIDNPAGIAAFALNDFDSAEKHLKLARENKQRLGSGASPVDDLVQELLKDPARFKKAWAEEQKIRQAEAEADDLPRVLLKTSKGDIELELFENEAPNTVANFISLVEKKFYDGLTFHRVLPGFMAQGGCPKGDGAGGPPYRIPCECYPPDKFRLHFRGSLSMAKGEARDSGGSQFFITFLPTSGLDGRHTVFGRVVKGLEVLHRIQRRDPERPNSPEPDKIVEAKVLRKRDHEYVPTTLPN